jgi:hypothetical protein
MQENILDYRNTEIASSHLAVLPRNDNLFVIVNKIDAEEY